MKTGKLRALLATLALLSLVTMQCVAPTPAPPVAEPVACRRPSSPRDSEPLILRGLGKPVEETG